jgi:ATP-dependent DNA helicase RecQ
MDYDNALLKFGLKAFRPGQRQVIEEIVAGHDCLCVMPTGGGKSLCFQLPTVLRNGLTIVVSPLIALMKDQVDSLCRRGIAATLINSTLSNAEQNQRLAEVASGKYSLLYVAPERLRNPRFLDVIRATPVQLLAVDEAHCISEWGHDFRPDYARLGQFRSAPQQAASSILRAESKVGRLYRGTLTVWLSNSLVHQEAEFSRKPLLEKLQAALPHLKLKKLAFRVGA